MNKVVEFNNNYKASFNLCLFMYELNVSGSLYEFSHHDNGNFLKLCGKDETQKIVHMKNTLFKKNLLQY